MSNSAFAQELLSPFKAIRLSYLQQLLQDETVDRKSIEDALLVENVPTDIFQYRDRERHLEGLLKSLTTSKCEVTHVAMFKFLVGSLYVNFEKFWGPTVRIIIDVLEITKFQKTLLDILLSHLKETNDLIYEKVDDSNTSTINNEFSDTSKSNDRPDHILHRNFIFQILNKFHHYVETNNTKFMDEFFRFIHKEMLTSPFIETFTRDNLTVNSDCQDKNGNSTVIQKKKSRETFITAIKIIQSFKSIKKVSRQEELRELLLNFLCCRDGSIQRATFNCIQAYEDDYLIPYIDRISKILSDKMVRTELTLFSVDAEESHQIQKKHRAKLMPIIMRIMFGKMIGKIGRKSSGRDKSDQRKSLVMRFIACCAPSEIEFFFELLFDPIFKYTEISYEVLKISLDNDIDLENYVPLNKLQAMLGSLSAFMESVAHLQEESLVKVLKLINIITYHVITPLENSKFSNRVDQRYLVTLKVLKRNCINIVSDFFRMFEYYEYTKEEVDFIFESLIWNSTSGFVDKNYANPTPILKLIEAFATNSIYHCLLVKRNERNREEYLLKHIIDLYCSPKVTRLVDKFIATLIADVLEPNRCPIDQEPEYESDVEMNNQGDQNRMLQFDDCLIPSYDKSFYKITTAIPYNEEIIISFIPVIFEKLQRNLEEFAKKKDSDVKIDQEELTILSKLSVYLIDSKQSLMGAQLLLSTLSFQKKNDLILNTLKTVQVLIQQVDDLGDSTIIPLVGDIMSYQRNMVQRKEICNIIELMSKINTNLITVSQALQMMNTESEEILGNLDLIKCNQGFKMTFSYLDELKEDQLNHPELVRDSITLLIYQVGYLMTNIDKFEFSIRENCNIFFERLAQKLNLIDLTKNREFAKLIIDEILLEGFIKKGIRDTNDAVKHTYIGVLRALAMYCHEKSRTLGEFHLFCDQNQEVDFWLNIRHIQLHNRSKALARIIASEEIDKVSAKTLSSYFMPLAAGFLFSKTYKSVSSLADNAIKLIGMICKHLNWITYESTLSYYLSLLTKANATYLKTNIKLITEILKNFNFDITACEEAMKDEEENAKLEKRMRKRRGGGSENNGEDDGRVVVADAPSGKKLNPSTARMVYFAVTKKIIPRLNSSLHEMTRVEFEHDKQMSDYVPEKDEIKRVPMAYAIVQLLNLLPSRYIMFRDHLPTLFLKLSSFLKSKNEDVRKATRATLIKIMSFVGPAYMPDFLRVLKQSLDKGFQIHVLNYTIHSVLDKLPLKYGSLDNSAEELVNSCFQEIFGKLAEDKEIAQILAKTYEAKKTKSYETLLILSSHISLEKLDYLMNSIKEVAKTSNEPKTVNKLSVCIQKVFTGLAKNDSFPIEGLLTFIKTTIEEYIPNLRVREKIDEVEKSNLHLQEHKSKQATLRDDRYLIAKDLSRNRIKSRINEKGNSHMIIENCLRLLLNTFEKNKLVIRRRETYKKKLDGFIILLSTCLKSSSPKCVTRALKCIYFIANTKIDLPSFRTKSNSIMKKIFILLSLYNGVGMVQGDNFDMIGMCFKTLSLLLLKCEDVKIHGDQVRVLLTFIEQDLHDSARQATAFSTLHSLLQRRCESPELADIMNKVADLLVTSEDDTVRTLSIKIWQTYLLDYKHEGDLLQAHLTRFLRQLDYEFIDGRKSVIKMLTVIVTKFPEKLLRNYFELIFHLLAHRSVNEESKEVRDLVGKLIGLLVQRLPEKQTIIFEKFISAWASDTKCGLKLLALKLTSILIESCSGIFKSKPTRIAKTLDFVLDSLQYKKVFVKTQDNNTDIVDDSSSSPIDTTADNEINSNEISVTKTIEVEDKLHYHALRLFKRLLNKDLLQPVESRYLVKLKAIWQNISSHKLGSTYLPVVLTSCQLYQIFIKKTDLKQALTIEKPSTDNYLEWNARRIVQTLCDKYIELLDRAEESDQLLAYITEALVILGTYVAQSSATLDFEQTYLSSFKTDFLDHMINVPNLPNDGFDHHHFPYELNESKKRVNLTWLSIKIVMQAKKEAAMFRSTKFYRRNLVLSWSAAISQALGAKRLLPYAFLFTLTPVRELTDKGKGKIDEHSEIRNTLTLSEDLLKFMKSLLQVDVFNKIYTRVQLHYTKKRVERKKNEALSKVKKPQIRGVKRKSMEKKKKGRKLRKTC